MKNQVVVNLKKGTRYIVQGVYINANNNAESERTIGYTDLSTGISYSRDEDEFRLKFRLDNSSVQG